MLSLQRLVRQFDFITFKLFVAVAEERSVTRAAEREAIAASAVSKRITDLESSLNVKLFLRHKGGVELTDAGSALLQHARTILNDLSFLVSEITDYGNGIRGYLRILVSESLLSGTLPAVLNGFAQTYPFVHIDLQSEVSMEVVRSVQGDRADVGFFWGNIQTSGLSTLPCYSDKLVVVAPTGHPLATREAVSLDDIAGYELIGQERNSSFQMQLTNALANLGINKDMRLHVNSYDAVCNLVSAGFGIGIVSDHFLSHMKYGHRVAAIPFSEAWAVRNYFACYKQDSSPSQVTKIFVEHLLDCIKVEDLHSNLL